ncbi:unnamed protein product [Paramecium pentaurelia]|uniref:Uncharacterized protein n=1 Tax=Paramecium pentaurelia TaxID=43138 RepID=A0A8S1WND7_9CILI|nr:unnamed protein product [Paramecium pentaurelia]
MSDQVKELIEEMIPNIREEIIKELKPQYETQFQEQLNQAKQEITGSQFISNQLAEKRRELAQQIMNQIEQEFEQEKQSLIHNVSVSLSKSRSMQVLEQQLRQKIQKEYTGYVEEEVRKKIHLIKLNCQKSYEEDRIQMKNQMTNEFTERLQIHLDQLEQTKSQLTVDYQNQREKLLRIEAETKQFQSQKENQENTYGQQIQEIHEQIKLLQDQLSQIKALKHQAIKIKPQKKEIIQPQQQDTQSQLSPYQSAIKNQVLQECLIYEGLNIANFDELPDLFHLEIKQNGIDSKQTAQNLIPQYESNHIQKSEVAQTINTQINTHDSQIISFNISQPSIVKNTINQTQNNTGSTQQKQQISQQQQIQKQSQIQQEKENDPSIQGNYNFPKRSSHSPNQQRNSQDEQQTKKSSFINQSTIIEKLENLCKEKIRQSQTNSNQRQSKILLPQDHFEELFQIDSKDNQTTRNIKLLRQELQTKFLEDIQLEDYYFQQISFFKLNFVQQYPKNQQSQVTEKIQQLISIWNKGHLSFSERIDYIKRIINSSNSTYELEQILEECLMYYQQNELLIEKLQQRQSFRSQIMKENYLCQKNKKVFAALKSLTYEIKCLLKYKFFWREVDVDQIIMIDQFEQQLIDREEMKEEIKRKVEKKFK